jgi:Plasma-membrane choline transporter
MASDEGGGGEAEHDSKDRGTRLVAPADFDGPTQNRHCTDVFCLLLLVASWVVMSGIGGYALTKGDIRLVLYPLDYDGNICGTDYGAVDMTAFPYLLYVNSYGGGVCVKQCPNLKGLTQDNLTDVNTLITYAGVYQLPGSELDLTTNVLQVGDYSNSSDAIACTEANCFPNSTSVASSWTSAGIAMGYGYAYYAATTYELLHRCYITTDAERRLEALTGANTTTTIASSGLSAEAYNFWNKLYADVYLARKYVLGFGFGASMAVSMAYIFVMRLPGLLTGIVWTSIVATVALFFLGGYYAWSQATAWDDANPKTVNDRTIHLTSIGAIVLFAIGGVLVLLGCCLRRAIMEAIKCTKEAGKAVNSMTIILLVPFLQSIGFLLFLVPFVYYAAAIASLGKLTTVDVAVPPTSVGAAVDTVTGSQPEIAYRYFEYDVFTKRCGWYMLFSLFWTANFIVAMGDVSYCFGIILFCWIFFLVPNPCGGRAVAHENSRFSPFPSAFSLSLLSRWRNGTLRRIRLLLEAGPC